MTKERSSEALDGMNHDPRRLGDRSMSPGPGEHAPWAATLRAWLAIDPDREALIPRTCHSDALEIS